MVYYQCLVLMLLIFVCKIEEPAIDIYYAGELTKKKETDGCSNARRSSSLTRRTRISECEGVLFTDVHTHLVSNPSCFCQAYPTVWSFNHVLHLFHTHLIIKPHQCVLIHLSMWFETDADWCTLAESSSGMNRSGEFAFAPC